MREEIILRIPEKNARDYLPDDVGKRLGDSLREIRLVTGDPLVEQLRRLVREYRKRGEVFFTGWNIQRRYSRRALEEAVLLQFWPKTVFEPAGEECGTVYDDESACNHVFEPASEMVVSGYRIPMAASTCGTGSLQVTPLYLDGRHIPGKADFARTIADEVVVSARVRDLFSKKGLTGVEFNPVLLCNKDGRPSQQHFQLNVVGPRVELHASTKAGANYFDETSYGRCPRGHVAGLNLLSEVHVQKTSLAETDVLATKQLIGVRRGILRPHPILLLSQRAWRIITNAKLRGLIFEIAHIKEPTHLM